MSSLLLHASPWTNENNNNSSNNNNNKKRTPSMINTFNKFSVDNYPSKMNENTDKYDNFTPKMENDESYNIPTLENDQQINNNRNEKVNDLLNKLTNVSVENDGSKLANFNPPPKPSLNVKKDDVISPNELLPKNTSNSNNKYFDQSNSNNYMPNNLGNYSDYRRSYENTTSMNKLLSSSQSNSLSNNSNLYDNRILEKINYMIHLLEEQQHEKTNNVAEEFVLYSFLGIFMIFIVDSFAKSGKYVR